ncbi:Gfo/Idh/MocA family protein [Roseicitreum antarcticum]|uniref:Oxidoreductase family, NAD-binding Rossmann fold n=1 Tax=Roseicitreum antarcticum TaxID=564137 RepID=A0A1H2YLJ6_9RHOB|nr:Gfo/Idh/MocA family oxidoreductase [Roseicitreum antarcticum]SDX05865.1 Oxidoreductase family, NAD-binding Rossmann fold [Roseicitreum antarcticum]
MTIRFAVCGTAFWAEQVHLPGLMAHSDLTVAGVWGRTPERTRALADPLGITAFDSFDSMLDAVDAVSFAVPPSVQAELAPIAIARGKHVILEKPLGPTIDGALTILRGLAENKVAGLCFLTRMFVDEMDAFVSEARAINPREGFATFRSGALLDGPYAGSAWRQEEHGALWDAAPHGLSVLVSVLGPIAEIAASLGDDGTYEFTCRHVNGGQSSFGLNLRDASVKLAESYRFQNGKTVELPSLPYNRKETFRKAADVLLQEISGRSDGKSAQLDLALHLVCVATAAQQSLSSADAFVRVQTPKP